jgi:cytochrome d ubiquinol oxidase subunit II
MAHRMSIALWIGVALIFLTAYFEGIPMIHWVFGNPVSILAGACSLCGFIILWVLVQKGSIRGTRICAGAMVTTMLIAGTISHYPEIILLKGGGSVSLFDQGGSPETMSMLAIALLGGGLFIVPSLAYLVYSFDKPVK